ncbi:espin-like [Hydractinia symbiolongicarpus]|uniref:espin-like n=1 Tax=Hydractinia symbiolongicarpus TaxID=13093 RepID=UPI00254C689F|nr:espin-like [Hydractinia symbiolongicarpus]
MEEDKPTQIGMMSKRQSVIRRVPQLDAYTGEAIPEWKQQIYMKKIEKQIEAEERLRKTDELRREREKARLSGPTWQQELVLKNRIKELSSDDPLIIRKRNIKAIQTEIDQDHSPPWQKELLQKRINRLQSEIENIEKERRTQHEKRKASMAGPVNNYFYEKNDIEPFD